MRLSQIRREIISLLLVAIAAPITASPAAAIEAPSPPSSRLASPEIFGYLPYWSLDAQIDFGAITTIAYFGLEGRPDGTLGRYQPGGGKTTEYARWTRSNVTNLIGEAHAAGVKFALTVERFAWSENGRAETRALLTSPEARTSLAADIVSELALRDLDGVSLDFEPILADQRDNFATFVAELRAALDAADPSYQLTFATMGWQSNDALEMFGALTSAGHADAVIIMAYPLREGGANKAGSISPLRSSVATDINQITRDYLTTVAPGSLIVALPWYGRTWATSGPELHALTLSDRTLYGDRDPMGYGDAIGYAIEHGRLYDEVEDSAWTVYPHRWCADCPDYWRQIYYDDVESLAAKYDYVTEQGLRGIGIWALGYDLDSVDMWKLLRVKYRGLVDTTPPTGTFVAPDNDHCDPGGLRLAFALDDGAEGSGPAFIRVSGAPTLGADGLLANARMYPHTDRLVFPTDDPAFGGSDSHGERTIYAQWRDISGNWSAVRTLTYDQPARAAGEMTVAAGSTVVAHPDVPVSIASTGDRDFDLVRFSSVPKTLADGSLEYGQGAAPGATVSYSLVDPATGGTDLDGARTVYGQWRDVLGCWSEPMQATILLDRTAPTGSLSVVGSPALVTSPQVQVLAPASDSTSHVEAVELSNNGNTWTSFTAGDDPISWAATDVPDGAWTIHARWTDAAGNRSEVATTMVDLDANGPTGTITIDGGAAATNAETVTIRDVATDAVSTVAELLLSNLPDVVDGVLAGATAFAANSIVQWSLAGAGTPEGVAEGSHTVYAQWRDSAGHLSDVAAATVTFDKTAPSLTVPQPMLRQGGQLEAESVAVKVTWSANDAVSGVSTQAIDISTATPSQLPPISFSSASSPTSIELPRSNSWVLRATAADAAGNVSTAQSSPFGVRIKEDSSSSISYSGKWTSVNKSTASSGSARYAAARGATATWTFTGRSVAWVAARTPKSGEAKVFVDGVLAEVVDLRSSTNSPRELVFARSWASPGTHTITIRVLGTRRVEVDALVGLT